MGKLIRVITGKQHDVLGVRKNRLVAGRIARTMGDLSHALFLAVRSVMRAAEATPSWQSCSAQAPAPAGQRLGGYGRPYRPGDRLPTPRS